MEQSLREIAQHLTRAALSPAFSIQSSSERVYWLYLSGAGVLGALVWWKNSREKSGLFAFLFPRSVFLHPSALFDVRFMVGRALLGLVVGAPLLVSAAVASTWLRLHFAQMSESPLDVPNSWALPLITVGAFLTEDFFRYWVHRATHNVPFLWELHKVHHSAEVLTPFTIYRTHPIEGFLMRTGSALGLAFGAATSAWLLGAPLSTWEVLGVQGLSVVWNATGANLRHSHIWLRYPTWVEHLVISPAQHQLHHSRDKQHFDANYGSAFALWDWMFGSLCIEKKRPELRFGLAPQEMNHGPSVLSALLSPMRHAALRLFPAGLLRELKKSPTAQEFAHPRPPQS